MMDSNIRLALILSVLCFSYIQLNAYIANEIVFSPRMATEQSIDSSLSWNPHHNDSLILDSPSDEALQTEAFYNFQEQSISMNEKIRTGSEGLKAGVLGGDLNSNSWTETLKLNSQSA